MGPPLPDTSLIARHLAQVPGVRLALLFGSTVSGRTRSDSDIDVAVWLAPNGPSSRYEMTRALLGALGRVLPASRIDLVILNDAGSRLAAEVARHGRVVYEGETGEIQRFRRYTAARLQDTEPRRRMIFPIRMKRLREENSHGRSGDILAKARSLARLFE
jgi:predicted nucleotidyltransferase